MYSLEDSLLHCTANITMTVKGQMRLVTLDKTSDTPLTEQIVLAVQHLIENRALRSGQRMPSIRGFAINHEISRFTVVQAYDRLIAAGYLHSRPGSGFYVQKNTNQSIQASPSLKLDSAMDVLWLLRNTLSQVTRDPMPGSGWLPHEWLDSAGIQQCMRKVISQPGKHLTDYGTPQGYVPLRQQLQQRVSEFQVQIDTEQVLLTNSTTHSLDLIARYYVRPGDAVLVDDPGYFILNGTLKSYGANIIGVPWNTDGPDVVKLEQLIKEHQPRLFFTNTILHNPTGASISQAVAYRLLQLAEQADMLIIEDDVYGDFHPANISRLATLDQLQRVIYIGSFSKTISSSIRVGFIVSSREITQQLTDLKLLSGITSSEINERIIHQMLVSGQYRKYLNKLHKRLQQSREQALENFEKMGLQIYLEPMGGMFIWVKMPAQINVVELAQQAADQGIMLAPGNLFRPHQEPSEWMRFNVSSCNEVLFLTFLKQALAKV